MFELFFVIKVFLFTVVVMALMQIKVGNQSLEQHSSRWLRSSNVVGILNSVSVGASKALNDGYNYIKNTMNAKMGSNEHPEKSNTQVASSGTAFHSVNIRHQNRVTENREQAQTSTPILKDVKFVHESQL